MTRAPAPHQAPGAVETPPGVVRTPPEIVGTALWLIGMALALATVGLQIAYPPASAGTRTTLSVITVLTFAAAGLADSARLVALRGPLMLLAAAALPGGLAEMVGVHTGVPFGSYRYDGTLGPQLLGVPLIVPLAWTMAAWPAWRVAATIAHRRLGRWLVAAWALASWDLFLDPQMVAAGHWRWSNPHPALPGVPGIPVSNYLGWLLVAGVVAGALELLLGSRLPLAGGPGAVVGVLAAWTWIGGIIANAVYFDRPGVALWGGVAMGLVALPAIRAAARRLHPPSRVASRIRP